MLDVRMQAVIAAGARSMVVTGMLPLGCEPELLALFPGDDEDDYDRVSGCITLFNELAELHNRALNGMLRKLQRSNPAPPSSTPTSTAPYPISSPRPANMVPARAT